MSTLVEGPSGADAEGDAPPRAGDGFTPYAVHSRSGPHVTIQAGVIGGGRFWTTTSRDSLKARSVRSHGVASALVEQDDGHVELLGGPTVALDPVRPSHAADDPLALLGAGPAIAHMLGDQVLQAIGYLEAQESVPGDWLPHHRVVLATRIERRLVLAGYDVVDGEGIWLPRLVDPTRRLRATPAAPAPLAAVPRRVRHLITGDRPARLGLSTQAGPVVLPARWRGDDRFDVSASALSCVAAELPGPGAVTFDDSASRRPDEKLGMLLRGDAVLVGVDGTRATVALRARRATIWDGFSADTVDATP